MSASKMNKEDSKDDAGKDGGVIYQQLRKLINVIVRNFKDV
jgi:hypothetical protein